MSSAGEGKTRLRFVRTDESSGVKVGRLSSGREGLVNGMLTASGPRKMTFSTLAETRAVAAERRRMRERESMPRGGAIVAIERQAADPHKRSSLLERTAWIVARDGTPTDQRSVSRSVKLPYTRYVRG
jgi:hypothetical protein